MVKWNLMNFYNSLALCYGYHGWSVLWTCSENVHIIWHINIFCTMSRLLCIVIFLVCHNHFANSMDSSHHGSTLLGKKILKIPEKFEFQNVNLRFNYLIRFTINFKNLCAHLAAFSPIFFCFWLFKILKGVMQCWNESFFWMNPNLESYL